MVKKKKRGKLIVIDGTDGSGKTTQMNLLMKRLKKDGFKNLLIVEKKKLDLRNFDKEFYLNDIIAHGLSLILYYYILVLYCN